MANLRGRRWLAILAVVVLPVASAASALSVQEQEAFKIADIRLEGIRRLPPSVVFADIPANIGDYVDSRMIALIARSLFKSNNFDDVQIGRDGNILVVRVAERPLVNRLEIEGNKAIKEDDLLRAMKKSGLAEGQVLQRAVFKNVAQELKKEYSKQGRYDASVKTEITERPRNRVDVLLLIDEGSSKRIERINIIGNRAFDDKELLEKFELRGRKDASWFSTRNKFSLEKLRADIDSLRAWYLDQGYLRFAINAVQVSLAPDFGSIYISIAIEEGERYTISAVEFFGDTVLSADLLQKVAEEAKGKQFSNAFTTQTEDGLAVLLNNEGYQNAQVSAIQKIDSEKNTVQVRFFIDPGIRTYVRRIQFSGNSRTSDEVLRREMRQMESAPASNQRIEQSKLRLERLGFFKQVDFKQHPVEGAEDQVDLEFLVEEQPFGSISASLGYSQLLGLQYGFNIEQNNFLGSGQRLVIGLLRSSFQEAYSVSHVNPYFTSDGVSRSLSVAYSRLDFSQINVASYATNTFNGNITIGYPINETERLQLGLGFSEIEIRTGPSAVQEISGSPRPFDGVPHMAFFDTGTHAGDTNDPWVVEDLISLQASDFHSRPQGFIDTHGAAFNNVIVNGGWSQFRLNRGQLATRGYSQNLNLQLALPGSEIEYYKVFYDGQIFLPLSEKLTLRLHARLGFGDGLGNTERLPFFEHYFSGGFNSVRGFEGNSLGPRSSAAISYNLLSGNALQPYQRVSTVVTTEATETTPATTSPEYDLNPYYLTGINGADCGGLCVLPQSSTSPFGGNAMMVGNLEVLFPLPFIDDQRSVRTAFFVDVGNVFNTRCRSWQAECYSFDVSELRYSVGVGITWITAIGPLTFSYARPYNVGRLDQTEFFQFSIGRGFYY